MADPNRIDGLRPTWQPAMIYRPTFYIIYYMYISLANKIVVAAAAACALRYQSALVDHELISYRYSLILLLLLF